MLCFPIPPFCPSSPQQSFSKFPSIFHTHSFYTKHETQKSQTSDQHVCAKFQLQLPRLTHKSSKSTNAKPICMGSENQEEKSKGHPKSSKTLQPLFCACNATNGRSDSSPSSMLLGDNQLLLCKYYHMTVSAVGLMPLLPLFIPPGRWLYLLRLISTAS